MTGIKPYFNEFAQARGQRLESLLVHSQRSVHIGVVRVTTAAVALCLYLSYHPRSRNWFGPHGLLSENAILKLRDMPVFSVFDYAHSSTPLWTFYWIGATACWPCSSLDSSPACTAVLALLAVLSLLHRGPVLARPVDDIVAMLMFYLCFGPCGAALSIDAWWKRRMAIARAGRQIRAAVELGGDCGHPLDPGPCLGHLFRHGDGEVAKFRRGGKEWPCGG